MFRTQQEKINHTYKEIGKYVPFKGKNKSTEIIPEKDVMADVTEKDLLKLS